MEFIRVQKELQYRDHTRLKNEIGRELDREHEERQELEREKAFEKEWEKTRQDRIKSWKKFSDSKEKVVKKKKKVFGAVPSYVTKAAKAAAAKESRPVQSGSIKK